MPRSCLTGDIQPVGSPASRGARSSVQPLPALRVGQGQRLQSMPRWAPLRGVDPPAGASMAPAGRLSTAAHAVALGPGAQRLAVLGPRTRAGRRARCGNLPQRRPHLTPRRGVVVETGRGPRGAVGRGHRAGAPANTGGPSRVRRRASPAARGVATRPCEVDAASGQHHERDLSSPAAAPAAPQRLPHALLDSVTVCSVTRERGRRCTPPTRRRAPHGCICAGARPARSQAPPGSPSPARASAHPGPRPAHPNHRLSPAR